MLYIPSNSKYKKQQKGKSCNFISKSNKYFQLKFGSVGLKAVSFGHLDSKEIKTAHQILKKVLKKRGFIKINIYSQTPVSKKPLEIRMGKGKGNVNNWVVKIKPGTLLLEIETEFKSFALKGLKLIQSRFSLNTKIIFI